MSLNIRIEGLVEIENILKRNPDLEFIRADISIGLLRLTDYINDEVQLRYNVPYSPDSIFLGDFVDINSSGSVAQADLSYKDKFVSLSEYPYVVSDVSDVRNAIPFKRTRKDGSEATNYIPVNKARSVRVNIRRRGGGGSNYSQKTKFKKFEAGGTIFARTQKETWLEIPTMGDDGKIEGGIHTPIRELAGPSVAKLIENVITNSPALEKAVNNIMETAIKGFNRFYA